MSDAGTRAVLERRQRVMRRLAFGWVALASGGFAAFVGWYGWLIYVRGVPLSDPRIQRALQDPLAAMASSLTDVITFSVLSLGSLVIAAYALGTAADYTNRVFSDE